MTREERQIQSRAINRRLQEAILQSGRTYHQIAQLAGVYDNSVSRIMSREQGLPSLVDLAGLCRALKVRPDAILGWEEARP